MRRPSRRDLLGSLAASGVIGLSGCQGLPRLGDAGAAEEIASRPVRPIETDRLVGAHYYPWYEMHAGHVDWTLRTTAEPVLGEYNASDPSVVDVHLTWCLNHGIRWLSTSWWGPGTGTDRALKNAVLAAEPADLMRFSILYETVGRLQGFGFDLDRRDARRQLRDDLRYLEETYFQRENYLRFDGRPVLFIYVANTLRGDLPAAFEAVTSGLEENPYVLADVPFNTPPGNYPVVDVADAVTSYNPYEARPDIEDVFHDTFRQGSWLLHRGAEAADVEYVPVVIPGYNDTALPASQRKDNPILAASPERFQRVCEQVAPHLDDARAVLITSFNEWYENTQVEPSEADGERYLEIVADSLASGDVTGTGTTAGRGAHLTLAFEKTVAPASIDESSEDRRELAVMVERLAVLAGGEPVKTYDVGVPGAEPVYLEGAYPPESHEGRTWRWFGGATGETELLVDVDPMSVDTAVITGRPVVPTGIAAVVSFAGQRTARVEFPARGGGLEEYPFSLTTG